MSKYGEVTEEWESISNAVGLLYEVKDIRDELNMLEALLSQQKCVWDALVEASASLGDAKGPAYILQGTNELCEVTDTIQTSVNKLLNLEQNSIGITEAVEARNQADEQVRQGEESARQGKKLMVFTIVTLVFTPLSFLSSLFVLNISSFQHDAEGNLLYHPGWIFPVLFRTSVAISIPLMIVAVYVEENRDLVKRTPEANPELCGSTEGQTGPK
ncbi:hypothetical protein BDW62DRAFT_198908 [Aspergillus aurantiobrunneus]